MKIRNQVSVFALALGLAAAPALAQDTTDTMTAPDPALTAPAPVPEAPEGSDVTVVDVESGTAAPAGTLADTAFANMTAEDLIGKSVVNADGETIGDIEDVVLDADQKAIYAVLSVGGFLGIGSKSVAIPFDQLQIGEDEATLMSSVTEDQLSEMANYAADAYAPLSPDSPLGGAMPLVGGTAAEDAAADIAPAEDVTAEQPIDETMAEQPAAEAPADATDTTATDTAAAVETEALDAQEPAAGEATDESSVARASPFADMTAEDLLGKSVVNTAGEDIGEISNLVISDDKAVLAVISVGGFLGVGEKDVAVPLDDLQVGEDAAVLMSGLTKEALEAMPAYETDTWPVLEGDQPVYQQ